MVALALSWLPSQPAARESSADQRCRAGRRDRTNTVTVVRPLAVWLRAERPISVFE
jgi:hypothetical protein